MRTCRLVCICNCSGFIGSLRTTLASGHFLASAAARQIEQAHVLRRSLKQSSRLNDSYLSITSPYWPGRACRPFLVTKKLDAAQSFDMAIFSSIRLFHASRESFSYSPGASEQGPGLPRLLDTRLLYVDRTFVLRVDSPVLAEMRRSR